MTAWTRQQWREEGARIGALLESKLKEVGQEHLKVRWEWNNKFTRRMGDALPNRDRKGGKIRFSTPLWPAASVEEREETVLHELAHIIVECVHGPRFRWTSSGRKLERHDSIWRSMLIRLGGTGARTHNVDRTHVKRRQSRFGGPCPRCSQLISFSKAVRTKWLRQRQVRRHGCGQTLDVTWALNAKRVA